MASILLLNWQFLWIQLDESIFFNTNQGRHMDLFKNLSANKLISYICIIVFALVFAITNSNLQHSSYGFIQLSLTHGTIVIIPTSIIFSLFSGLLIYALLSHLSRGFYQVSSGDALEDCRAPKTFLNKNLIIFALAVITAYAGFHINEEILAISENGNIAIEASPGKVIFIPSAIILGFIFAWMIFLIATEFISGYGYRFVIRHSQSIRRMTGAILRPKSEAVKKS